MLKFVICDDEIYMVNRLSALFEKSFIKNNFNAEIILKTTDYNELISFVSSNSVDVVVLDIEFKSSKLTGLDIANQIRCAGWCNDSRYRDLSCCLYGRCRHL